MRLLILLLAGLFSGKIFRTANAEGLTGEHDSSCSRLSSAAITVRHLLYKQGADADHIAVCTATTDTPLGTVADEPTAAEVPVTLRLIGRGPTKRMVASAAIAAGVPVFLAANGQIASSGTVKVGESLTAAAALNDVIEVNDR